MTPLQKSCLAVLAGLVGVILWSFRDDLRFAPATPVVAEVNQPQTPEKPPDKDEELRWLMRTKLKSSQEILAALTRDDYKTLEKHGLRLIDLSQAAGWQAFQTPGYKQDSQEFRDHAQSLVDSAREKELSDCTEAYLKIVRSCVTCHDHVRAAAAGKPLPVESP